MTIIEQIARLVDPHAWDERFLLDAPTSALVYRKRSLARATVIATLVRDRTAEATEGMLAEVGKLPAARIVSLAVVMRGAMDGKASLASHQAPDTPLQQWHRAMHAALWRELLGEANDAT